MTTQEVIATGIRVQLAILNKNQSWLARQANCSKQALTARMVGRVNFDTDDLDKFSRHLELRVEDLTSGALIPAFDHQCLSKEGVVTR